jgi:ryanodine receptor 2
LSYTPRPIDISRVQLPQALSDLTERLAEHAHDVWAAQRLRDGWTFGPRRDDAAKTHPCLVPYDQLPDSEKQYDRNAVEGTLQAVLALGYRIEGPA